MPNGPDPHHLQRFLDAQATTYKQAHTELAAGEKRSHWMWFIFPQIGGLGSSATAREYAIANLAEATAFLQHSVLGPRLREVTALVNSLEGRSLEEIFGYPDNLKFHSCVTLFAEAATDEPDKVFSEALSLYFNGEPDTATLDKLDLR